MAHDYSQQKTFLDEVDKLVIDGFYKMLGNYFIDQGYRWESAWKGNTPNMIDLGVFKKYLREKIKLDLTGIDINPNIYKTGKPENEEKFWETPGAELINRIRTVLGGSSSMQLVAEVTKPTPPMEIGTVPDAAGVAQIHASEEWQDLRTTLNNGLSAEVRLTAIQAILDKNTVTARLLKKACCFIGEVTAVTVKPEDTKRVEITNTIREYGNLRGTSMRTAINETLSGHEILISDITSRDILAAIMGFVTATQQDFHKVLDKAVALMMRCTVAQLREQGSQGLAEAMEAIIVVLRSTLGDLVGSRDGTATKRASLIMRKWSVLDPTFSYWNAPGFYENSLGGAYALVEEIFYPIMTTWLNKVWECIHRGGDRPNTLESTLEYETLRVHNESFSQMSSFVQTIKVMKKGVVGKPAGAVANPAHTDPNKCGHCGNPGHVESRCYTLHPHLKKEDAAARKAKGKGGGKGGGKAAQKKAAKAARAAALAAQWGTTVAQQQAAWQQQQPQPQAVWSPHAGGWTAPPPSHGSPPGFPGFGGAFAGFSMGSPGGGKGKGDSRSCYACGQAGHISRDCSASAAAFNAAAGQGRGQGGQTPPPAPAGGFPPGNLTQWGGSPATGGGGWANGEAKAAKHG